MRTLIDAGPLVALFSKREDPASRVFTLDDDFYVYRTADGKALNVLSP